MAKELVFDVKVNNLDDAQKSFGQLKEDVKNLRRELESTPIGSKRFEELTAEIQKAGFQMREVKKDLREMSSGAQQLGDLSEGASAITRGFAMAASAAALFGEENEKAAQEAIKNVVALTSLAEGLGQIPQMVKGLGKAFDVLKANPFILITAAVIGLLAATGNLDDIMQILSDTFNQIMESIGPVIDELLTLLSDAIEPLLKLLMPLLKLALIPLQLAFKALAVVLELITPTIEVISLAIQELSGFLLNIADAVLGAVDSFLSFIGVSSEVDKGVKKTKVNMEDLKKTQEDFRSSNDILNKSYQRQIDLMKAQGKSIDDIETKELNLIKVKLSQAEAEFKIAQSIRTRLELEGKALTGDQLKLYNDVEQNFLDLKNQVAIKEAEIDKRRKEESKKDAEDRNKNSEKSYDELLKKQQDFIAKANKDLDTEYVKKQTQLYSDFGSGLIKTEEELNKKLDDLDSQKLISQKINLQKQIDEVNNNEKIKKEDKIKLTTQLGDQIIKLDNDIAKRLVENTKKNNAEQEKKDKENFDKKYGQEKLDLVKKYNDGEIKAKEDLDIKLAELDLKRSNEELQKLDVGSKEYIDKLTEITNKEIDLKQQKADRVVQIQDDEIERIKKAQDKKKAEDEKELKKKTDSIKAVINSVNLISNIGAGFDSLFSNIVAGFGNISAGAEKFANTLVTAKTTAEKVAAGLELAGKIAGEIGNILSQNSERNLMKIEEEKNAEIMALEEQKNAGIISEAQFNAAKEKIDNAARKKELQEKRKAFNQNKAIKISEAVIATAQAIVAAQILPFPLNTIQTVIAAAVGAAQIGIIAAQKFPEGGGSGGSGGSGSISTPSIPNTGAVGGATEVSNQPNLVQRGLEAQKVYILESEITDSQNRVDVIETRARF
jgi:hypothetical protein